MFLRISLFWLNDFFLNMGIMFFGIVHCSKSSANNGGGGDGVK